jgi:alpha-tubulin suppressor-like RCC1 family protein
MKRIALFLECVVLCAALVAGESVPVQANHAAGQPSLRASGAAGIYLPLAMQDYYELLPPIIPDTTEVLTSITTDHLASVSGDGVEFIFTQSTPELEALTTGDIMAGNTSPNAPNGFLRKVTSIQTVGGQVVVDTSAATLDEAIQQGEVNIDQALTPDQIQTAQYAPGVGLASSSSESQAATFYLEIKDMVLYDDDGNPNTTDDQVLGNGSIEIEPTLHFNLQIKDWHLVQLIYTQSLHDRVEIKVESKITLAELKHEWELVRYQLKPIPVMIGWLPVLLNPVITFVFGVDGNIHVSVSTQVTQEATLTGGLQYINGSWEPVSQFANQFQWQPPTLSAELDLKGYAGPRLEILLYGVVGPQIKLYGYGKLEANIAETPWWKLYGGLELSAAIRMEILSRVIANHDFPVVIGVKWLLASAPTSIETVPISTGYSHTCALTHAGEVMCWGDNTNGVLGDGTVIEKHTPVYVVGLADGIKSISASWSHTCALTQSGGVKCWGRNYAGELGDGGAESFSLTPVDVTGLAGGVISISAVGSHTCALTQAGGVKCWGDNDHGELGDGGEEPFSTTPVDVTGLASGVSSISAGLAHSCALTKAGGVKCWGWNYYGQLGDGTTIDKSTPVDLPMLASGVKAISAGVHHTCALMQSGGVKCWGRNAFGQLGDGTTIDNPTPVDVTGLGDVASDIHAGGWHTCARTQAGGIKCWGDNGTGQVGDGTTTNRLEPVDIVALASGINAISAGEFHTCAMMLAGNVKCWGLNGSGQLGDGSTINELAPVDVIGFP